VFGPGRFETDLFGALNDYVDGSSLFVFRLSVGDKSLDDILTFFLFPCRASFN